MLRRRHVDHVIVYETEERAAEHRAVHSCTVSRGSGLLLYEDGRTAIFGWYDPDRPRRDPDRLRRAPPRPRPGRLPPRRRQEAPASWPGRPPQPPGWLDPFVKPRPLRSPDRDEAAAYLLQFDTLALGAGFRHGQAFDCASAAGLVGAAGAGTHRRRRRPARATAPGRDVPACGRRPPRSTSLAQQLLENSALALEDAPTGLLLLAVRRRAAPSARPPTTPPRTSSSARRYLRLSAHTSERAWARTLPMFRRLRQVQASAAFNQALLLKPDLPLAHTASPAFMGRWATPDLRLKHLKEFQKLTRAAGAGPRPRVPAEFERRQATLDDEVERLDEGVRRLTDVYAANALYLKVIDRANAALEKGLGGKALEVLLGSDFAAFAPPACGRNWNCCWPPVESGRSASG